MAVLREAIAAHQERFYGVHYDPNTEVLVTTGATEALASALLALLDTGDEVVVLEPMFDSYAPCIALAGAVAKPVTIRPPEYAIDPDELRAAFTAKTRLVLLNTPHNPTGRVFTRAELQLIADLVIEHDVILVTDEVYEHLVFDGIEYVSPASLPGLRERTLVISSGGKTFNTTGWKVGWICGPAPMVSAVRTAKQFLTYVNSGPFQPAIAKGLRLPDPFFADLSADLQAKRDRLVPGLQAAGFEVFPTSSTYFVTADIRSLRPDGNGMEFCKQLPGACGVVAIPAEVLYMNKHEGRHIVRFAFCKRLEILDEAVARLARLG